MIAVGSMVAGLGPGIIVRVDWRCDAGTFLMT